MGHVYVLVAALLIAIIVLLVLPWLLRAAQTTKMDEGVELPENKVLPEVINLDCQPGFPVEEVVAFRVGKTLYRALASDLTSVGVAIPNGRIYRLTKKGVRLVSTEYQGVGLDEVVGKLGVGIAQAVRS